MKYLLKNIILLIMLCANIIVFAQNDKSIDSLKRLLDKNISYFERIDANIKLSNKLDKQDSASRELYANKALSLARNLGNKNFIAKALTNKARLLIDNKEYEEATPYLLEVEKIYKEMGDSAKVASAYYDLAVAHKYISYNKSLDYHKRALAIWEQTDDTVMIIKSNMGVAFSFWGVGSLDSSKKYYLSTLKLCNPERDAKLIGASYSTLGTIFYRQGILDSALNYYSKAEEYRVKIQDWKGLSLTTTNIGLVYFEWKLYKEALFNFEIALENAKKAKFVEGAAYVYANIGLVDAKMKKYKLSLQNLDSAIKTYKLANKKDGMSMCYGYKGRIYKGIKKFSLAIEYYKKSVKLAMEIGSKSHQAENLLSMGESYFELKNYSEAEKCFISSLEIAQSENYKKIEMSNCMYLSIIEEEKGLYKEALNYKKRYVELRKELFDLESLQELSKIKAQYNNLQEKKDADARDKINEVRISNLTTITVIVIIFFIIISILYIIAQRSKIKLVKSEAFLTEQNTEIIKQKETLEKTESTLREINYLLYDKTNDLQKNKRKLQATIEELRKANEYRNKIFSIIGHDLRGPIGTINKIISLIMDEDLDNDKRDLMLSLTQKSAVSAYSLLENLLVWANNERGKIEYKPSNLNLYDVVVENINLLNETARDKGISINFTSDKNLQVYADFNMLSTIIRNLLANSIKFSKKDSEVKVSAQALGNNNVEVSVKDEGIGISQENLHKILNTNLHYTSRGTEGEPGSGLGLQLCFDFIKANKGNYNITSEEEKGSNFIFTLPAAQQ